MGMWHVSTDNQYKGGEVSTCDLVLSAHHKYTPYSCTLKYGVLYIIWFIALYKWHYTLAMTTAFLKLCITILTVPASE